MKRRKKPYELLEHAGDAYIAAHGGTLGEALENAARAMFDVMTDIGTVEAAVKDEFTVEAGDEVELLHEWLNKLLIAFDIEGKLYSKFKVKEIGGGDGGILLRAEAYGEPFNPSKHPSKVEVKAVTYHKMDVERRDGEVTVRFILDL
ncbi:MAG: archease [Candidatus Bathyarchaeia archaeon]|nr:archease [Candidatus Bathyarchaeota archaeon]